MNYENVTFRVVGALNDKTGYIIVISSTCKGNKQAAGIPLPQASIQPLKLLTVYEVPRIQIGEIEFKDPIISFG